MFIPAILSLLLAFADTSATETNFFPDNCVYHPELVRLVCPSSLYQHAQSGGDAGSAGGDSGAGSGAGAGSGSGDGCGPK